jgi:hypothetical protein
MIRDPLGPKVRQDRESTDITTTRN